MTAAIAILRMTSSQLMALKDLVVDYAINTPGHIEHFHDVTEDVTTSAMDLVQLVTRVEARLPVERPPNTITRVEFEAAIERSHAEEVRRREFEGLPAPPVGEAPSLTLSPACHPDPKIPLYVTYKDGLLILRCALCRAITQQILVGTVEGSDGELEPA